MHGGKSLGGIASPSFKTGRYSKALPLGLVERYQAAKADPERLSHGPEIALLDAKLDDFLQQLNKDNPQAALNAIREAWGKFEAATGNPNASPTVMLQGVREAITQAPTEGAGVWADVTDLIEQRSRTLERETKRLQTDTHMLDAGQLLGIIELVVEIMQNSVRRYADKPTSQRILSLFTDELSRVVTSPSSQPGQGSHPGIKQLN